jgi:hypothetical protein
MGHWVISRGGTRTWVEDPSPRSTIEDPPEFVPSPAPATTTRSGTETPFPNLMDLIQGYIQRYEKAPWEQGSYFGDLWSQLGPGGQPQRPGEYAETPFETGLGPAPTGYQMPTWNPSAYGGLTPEEVAQKSRELATLKLPSSAVVRQAAQPGVQAQAMAQARNLMNLNRTMRDLGGPAVSGAAVRQAALGNVAQTEATTESDMMKLLTQQQGALQQGVVQNYGAAATEAIRSAGETYRTQAQVEQQVWAKQYDDYLQAQRLEQERWNAVQERRFGAWQSNLSAWAAEFSARIGMGGTLVGSWSAGLPEWVDRYFAAVRLASEGITGEQAAPQTALPGVRTIVRR